MRSNNFVSSFMSTGWVQCQVESIIYIRITLETLPSFFLFYVCHVYKETCIYLSSLTLSLSYMHIFITSHFPSLSVIYTYIYLSSSSSSSIFTLSYMHIFIISISLTPYLSVIYSSSSSLSPLYCHI